MPFNEGNVTKTFRALVQPSKGGQSFPAIIKDLPQRELFNELVCFLVLQEMGLPVPLGYLGIVGATETGISLGPVLPEGQKLVFVSKEIPTPNLKLAIALPASPTPPQIEKCLRRVVPEIAKWNLLGELYAFDTWVANIDRNLGNILYGGLLSNGTPDIWIIDHGRSFTSEAWQSKDLIPDRSYKNMLQNWATPFLSNQNKNECLESAAHFETKAQSFDSSGKIDYLAKMFGLDRIDQEAAKNFLAVRAARVTEFSENALDMGRLPCHQ